MNEVIKSQILNIRDSGLTNMLDVKSVFNLAAKNDFYELADFVSEKPKEYSNFILTGKE